MDEITKRWKLEEILQKVKGFETPKVQFEQYITPPNLSSTIIWNALLNDDVSEKFVLDLGCGTGMLSIGCCVCGCSYVLGVELDEDALEIAKENVNTFEEETEFNVREKIDFLNCNVIDGHLERVIGGGQREFFDTIFLNPPFGTKSNRGIDLKFLKVATEINNEEQIKRTTIYSFHKSSTRDHIIKKVQEWGWNIEIVAQMNYDLPKTYKFHSKENKVIEVDLIRLTSKTNPNATIGDNVRKWELSSMDNNNEKNDGRKGGRNKKGSKRGRERNRGRGRGRNRGRGRGRKRKF